MRNTVVSVPAIKEPITKSPGFEKKELSNYKLDVMALCGFGCSYCSSNWGNYLRINREKFAAATEKQIGARVYPDTNPALTIVWPDVLERLQAQLAKKPRTWGEGETLVYSMLTDGFSPIQLKDGTTEKTLRMVLDRTSFRIRVLTKNAIVGSEYWITFFKAHPGRFVVGLSTGTLDDEWAKRVEIGTSLPSARLKALRTLQDVGVPTYGMICPAFPDVLEGGGIERLIDSVHPERVEHFWTEPYNDRVNWKNVRAGYPMGSPGYRWFTDVFENGQKDLWSRYATDLYLRLRAKAEREGWLPKLRFLLYELDITAEDAPKFGDLAGVLLQSAPGPDGLSQNPHFAKLQSRQKAAREVPVRAKPSTPLPKPTAVRKYGAVWTPELVRLWRDKATPQAQAAMRVLLGEPEGLSTAELNRRVGSDSGGPLVGGIMAWATKRGLPSPLVRLRRDGQAVYRFASDEIRRLFVKEAGKKPAL